MDEYDDSEVVVPPQKTVLVCFGERKRPVTYTMDERKSEKESLLSAVNEVFADVEGIGDDAEHLVQVKNEQWGGEFVDLKDEEKIPDRAVVRVVVGTKEAGKRGVTLCHNTARPSEAEAKALAKLFPSSALSSKKRPFDPTNQCCIAHKQKKKKAVHASGCLDEKLHSQSSTR